MNELTFSRAATCIDQANGVLITAGAGLGVDSGLPDFRGTEGFWRAYPALARARLRFESIASPSAFENDPELAWGFYGHRLNLYRRTVPHDGFRFIKQLNEQLPAGVFIFTSNVDGQFQKAGCPTDSICEVHGSIHHLQCMSGCTAAIWPAETFQPVVDETTCRLVNALPTCPHCGGLARPNILMFGDGGWLETRFRGQEAGLRRWLSRADRCVVIELGAGTAIPTVRRLGESIDAPLIRINLRESAVIRAGDMALPIGALDGLRGIEAALRALH